MAKRRSARGLRLAQSLAYNGSRILLFFSR
jgi:hypothetical protein